MRQKKLRGSYTIEAALLMGIILPLLVAVIYMGFYFHDKGFLQGAAHEAVCIADLRIDDLEKNTSGVSEQLIAGRMLGTRRTEGRIDAGDKIVQADYRGNFQVPGMTRIFWGSGQLQMAAKASLTTERPSKRIQKIRSVVKVIDKVRGK